MSQFIDTGGALAWNRDVVYVGGRAVAEVDSSMVHELHSDYQGTPRIITSLADPAGTVNGIQAFVPFGEQIKNPAYTAGYAPIIGYTGHLQTEANGNLIYMRGRFYSPAWHRFLNSDQGADPSQLNQFAYCGGNPMMRTDPSGMFMILGEDGKAHFGGGGKYYGPVVGVEAQSASGNPFAEQWVRDAQRAQNHGSAGAGNNGTTLKSGGYTLGVNWVKGGTWQDTPNGPAPVGPLTDGPGAGYGYTLSLLPQADGFSSLAGALDKAQSVGDISRLRAAERTAPIVGPLTVGLKVVSDSYTFDDMAMDVFLLNAVAALTVMQPELAPFTAAFLLAANLPPSGSTQAEAQQLQFQTTGFVGGSGIGY